MMTSDPYEASLRNLNLPVYLAGKRFENVVDHPTSDRKFDGLPRRKRASPD